MGGEYNIVNDDVVFTYTPSINTVSYSYVIIKDNEYLPKVDILNNNSTSVSLQGEGKYIVEFTEIDYLGNTKINVVNYMIDKTPPVIELNEKTYVIKTNDKFELDIKAHDIFDGDVKVESNIDSINFKESGIKEISLTATDRAGNNSSETIYVTVKKDNTSLVYLGLSIILVVILFLINLLFKYIKDIKYEKRISMYSLNSYKNKNISLFDKLFKQYKEFINKYSKYIKKSTLLIKKSGKYIKYNESFNLNDIDGSKFMFRKIIFGFIYIVIVIIINLFRLKLTTYYEMIIPFIIGFYTLDVVYSIRYSGYRKKLENDMLNAITIMNNAFKSGMSIMQAIELVSNNLEGPISSEFNKISEELSRGVDIEDAFYRFSRRINLKSAIYLTTSISVLNKTGGNIIKVFDSIEKTLYNKKKLDNEFKSLTSSSRMVFYILVCMPICFVLFLGLVNRDYYLPLINNKLGIILIVIIVLIYVAYIVVVKEVMKVRGLDE